MAPPTCVDQVPVHGMLDGSVLAQGMPLVDEQGG